MLSTYLGTLLDAAEVDRDEVQVDVDDLAIQACRGRDLLDFGRHVTLCRGQLENHGHVALGDTDTLG